MKKKACAHSRKSVLKVNIYAGEKIAGFDGIY